MKIVQKGNKQLRVADDRLNDMLSKGYLEIDEKTGKPIKKEMADSTAALKKEIAALRKTNKELTEQLNKLNSQE